MSETSVAETRSPVETGALIALATLGFAAVIGFVAVIDADNVAVAFGTGFGVATLVFLAGATIACALACLARRRLELVALGSIVAAGLAIDMIVLAIWLEIDNEAYGKTAGVAFVWSFYALVVLGLALAVPNPTNLARLPYVGAVAVTLVAGVISTWLIARAGGDDVVAGGEIPEDGSFGSVPYAAVGEDELLRALGASLVLLAALWFGALAADRLERVRQVTR